MIKSVNVEVDFENLIEVKKIKFFSERRYILERRSKQKLGVGVLQEYIAIV